jgi:hypothetical protein
MKTDIAGREPIEHVRPAQGKAVTQNELIQMLVRPVKIEDLARFYQLFEDTPGWSIADLPEEFRGQGRAVPGAILNAVRGTEESAMTEYTTSADVLTRDYPSEEVCVQLRRLFGTGRYPMLSNNVPVGGELYPFIAALLRSIAANEKGAK